MTAEKTNFPMPKWALPIWYDREAIFVALPTESDPYIVKLPYSEAGLNKVLQIMKFTHEEANKKASSLAERTHPIVKRFKRGSGVKAKKEPDFTNEQRANALAVLKKAGIIK